MLKKSITYVDYNDETRTEDFYFNLTKAELMELDLIYGGFKDYVQKLTDNGDPVALIAMFKDIIKRSYGEKTPDGKRFIKNDEIASDFINSPAYSELFISFLNDENAAKDFIFAVVPKDVASQAATIENK